MALLTGIQLDDKTPFRKWAEGILPWLNAVMEDVGKGTAEDIGPLKERQDRYTAYQGTLVELYSKAQAYYKDALARSMEKHMKDAPASLVARIAEQDCVNELRVFEAIHRLNSTLSDQLIAIASRLKFEGGYRDRPPFMEDRYS